MSVPVNTLLVMFKCLTCVNSDSYLMDILFLLFSGKLEFTVTEASLESPYRTKSVTGNGRKKLILA